MNETEIRERLVRIETKFEGLEEDFTEVKSTLKEIHESFVQAKGAKWAITSSIFVLGVLSTYMPDLFRYFNKG